VPGSARSIKGALSPQAAFFAKNPRSTDPMAAGAKHRSV
jgi:hypothetical protein